MPVSSALSMAATIGQTKALDLTTVADPLQFRRAVNLTDGTAAGKADRVFHDRRTLAASGTEDLDLAGVLLDAFGAAITFARVKGIYISAAAANTNNVIVGAASATQWATLLNAAGTVTLRPGATFGAMAGQADATAYAVTAGTGDLLKVANSGAGSSVTYDIVIVGASA
ncbi:hypothetical protein [Streptomyces sp. Je 1-369]|uniref:hypothetical protein n=1 Tax=Streptomyces sp. Je 1-369 TaxID=2966192 RepID=UPI0022863B7D|nr:hypothetical protein [Streptomyces sp. Je 1-369]WAL93996.1 hypothetical protein NOO62_05455 [Streptomyces sp. Je 1-369]